MNEAILSTSGVSTRLVAGKEEHVALSYELVGTGTVENGSAIYH